jgi:putative two-component system response regulator
VTVPFAAARIVVIDDQKANVALLERALTEWGYTNVISTTNSLEGLHLTRDSEPDLVLLDLMMPPPDGFEVMTRLAAHIHGEDFVPILALTADSSDGTKARALELGAKDFLEKPLNLTEVRLRVANLLDTRRLHLELREHADVLEQRVRERTQSLERARGEVLARLSLAAEYRDDDTNEHAQRVGRTAALLAEQLGLPEEEVERLRRAAPLHDIGKIGIPDAILLKPDRLTLDEFRLMQQHTEIGARILGGSTSRILQLSEEIAETHHERWDGAGYPAGLSAEEIPLAGRLVALADVFDALTHRRPYKDAVPVEIATSEVLNLAGTHLDPQIVETFKTLDPSMLLTRV